MQRYFIELSYDGTAYHGWQIQPNATTVQECLDKALSVYFRQSINTLGCGRTDTGVHATQFYAHFDLQNCPPEATENQVAAIPVRPFKVGSRNKCFTALSDRGKAGV